MKKTKLIIAVMAIVLLCACLFAGCKDKNAGSDEPDTFLVASEYESNNIPLVSSARKIPTFDGYSYSQGNSTLTVFYKTESGLTSYLVFDLETEMNVGSFIETDNVEYEVQTARVYTETKAVPFFVVRKEVRNTNDFSVTATETLYNQKGNVVNVNEEADDEYFNYSMKEDLVFFSDKVFRAADDGSFTMIRGQSEMQGAIPSFTEKFGEYYYNIDDNYNTDVTIIIYDKDFAIKAYYAFPSYIAGSFRQQVILNNGNVFVQYAIEKAETENDYDFVTQGQRYALRQQIISAADGSVKDVNLGSVMMYGTTRTEVEEQYNGLNKKYSNFAVLAPIVERHLTTSQDEMKMVAFSNDAEVEEEMNGMFMQYEQFGAWETVAANRVVVADKAGRTYLFAFDGALIGEVANDSRFLSKYVLTNTSIYDYNLAKLKDYDAEGFVYVGQIGEALVFTKTVDETNKRYLFVDGQMKQIAEGTYTALEVAYAYYVRVTENEIVSYNLYNAAGTKVATFDRALSVIGSANDKKFLLTTQTAEGVRVYYVVE